jgi:RNA polymerase alpha subunit
VSTSGGDGNLEQVGGLLGRMPDPERDREALLVLGEPDGDCCRGLAAELLRRRDWRGRPLGELMPGLSLLPAPLLWGRLSARSTKCLKRAGIGGTLALARKSSTGVTLLPEVGAKTSKEIVQAALGAWAAAHLEPVEVVPTERRRLRARADSAAGGLLEELRANPDLRTTPLGELLPGLDLLEDRRLFDRLGVRAMNCLFRTGAGNVQALAALAPSEIGALQHAGTRTVDEILTVVIREWAASQLAESGPPPRAEPKTPDLAAAFEDLEARPGFAVFRRRRLEADPRPTCRQLATELGITHQAVWQREATIEAGLKKSMRSADSPIRIAVEELRGHLGAVARPGELRRAIAELDRNRRTLEPDHRRALLIHLAEYRIGPEWVLAPDIESLTDVVLATHAHSGAGALDAVGRHLTALGVREELQLPWIVSRHGFRIIDGELLSAAVI